MLARHNQPFPPARSRVLCSISRRRTTTVTTWPLPLLLLLLLSFNYNNNNHVLVHSFGLFNFSNRGTKYVTQPINVQNRQQDELRLVTDLFVDSFWRGKVGGGTSELTGDQERTLLAQQYAEFRKRYSRSSSPSSTQMMILCKDSTKNNAIIGCAGVEVDTVATFAEGHEPDNNGLLGLLGQSSTPAKPTGRWETKMRYAPVMSNLVVSRQYRRQGIAEQLVAAVEDLCSDDWGYEDCYLYVEKRNAPAVKLYQKLGYQTLWQQDKAQTLIPTKRGKLENSSTVLLCMKKTLSKNNNKRRRQSGSSGNEGWWPFG